MSERSYHRALTWNSAEKTTNCNTMIVAYHNPTQPPSPPPPPPYTHIHTHWKPLNDVAIIDDCHLLK